MAFRDEVKIGDRLMVAWRDTKLPVMKGVVVAIDRAEVGQAYVVVPDGHDLVADGAVHVSEFAAVLSVWRTDCWLMLPLPFSRAEIEAKCRRMDANERKRVARNVPLFADVHAVRVLDPDEVERRSRAVDEEDYLYQRGRVEKCLAMRKRVELLLGPEAFAELLELHSTGFRASGDVTRRITLWMGVLGELEASAA